jgi:hypothetical protein
MDSEAPIGEIRRGFRHWRRVALILAAVPIFGLLLGYAVFASSWTSDWLAKKIQARVGLETRIGGISWSPWSAAEIRDLEFLQPKPLQALEKESLLKIGRVSFTPVWRAWLRGRFDVQSIALDSPRVVLPVELLAELGRSPAQPAPPPLAAAPPTAVAAQPAQPSTPPAPTSVAVTPPPVVQVPPQVPKPTGWIHLKNASFVILNATSRKTVLDISKTSGSIPISGEPAKGALTIGKASTFEQALSPDLTANFDWTPPLLSLNPLETQVGIYKLILAAKVATFSGFPVQLELQFPNQPLPPLSLPFGTQAAAQSISSNFRFRGLLLAPATWQGDLIAEAVSPTLHIATREARFDKGSAVTILRGGILSCVDARLIGDDFSLLGNATLLANGRLAGAARLVAPPDTITSITKQIFPILEGKPSLTPLATPQRAAFDVDAFGSLRQPFLRLGKDGPIVNLKP